MRKDTAGNILADTILELGLPAVAAADTYTSTDGNVVQLRALLKALGRDLVRDHQWSHLQKTYTFSTVNGTESYALPTDYDRLLNATQWNRTDNLPLNGPLNPQEWQLVKSSDVVNPVDFFFRVFGDKLYLHPVPSAAETIAYEYQSAYWVMPTGQTTPTTEAPTAYTDTLWFDYQLLSRGIKARWKSAKGLDATQEYVEYDRALARATGGDGVAPVLNLSPSRAPWPPVPRLPYTNWGV